MILYLLHYLDAIKIEDFQQLKPVGKYLYEKQYKDHSVGSAT